MKRLYFGVFLFLFGLTVLTKCGGLRPNPQLTGSHDSNPRSYEHEVPEPEALGSVAGNFQQRMLEMIDTYLGVPYRWGGTSRYGMDCSGFVTTIYQKALNMKLPRRTRTLFGFGSYVARQELEFGDLVFFTKAQNRGVSHVGIYVGKDKFVHASTTSGVIISDLSDPYYRNRFAGARRIYSPD